MKGLAGESVHTAGQRLEFTARAGQSMPGKYRFLIPEEVVDKGDFWYRPCDETWVETGVSHWGHIVKAGGDLFSRKNPWL